MLFTQIIFSVLQQAARQYPLTLFNNRNKGDAALFLNDCLTHKQSQQVLYQCKQYFQVHTGMQTSQLTCSLRNSNDSIFKPPHNNQLQANLKFFQAHNAPTNENSLTIINPPELLLSDDAAFLKQNIASKQALILRLTLKQEILNKQLSLIKRVNSQNLIELKQQIEVATKRVQLLKQKKSKQGFHIDTSRSLINLSRLITPHFTKTSPKA